VERGREPLHLPTEARAVADVSGAGDTLVATFAVMVAGGAGLPEAAHVANVAAGVAVGKPGTATVSQTELLSALHRQELLAFDEKIVALDEALARLAQWRRSGLRVGFTNGCFDLIHPGHVRLLNKARARCDRLVVALNTDASVQRLKGPTRPVQVELARATVMASIGAVDLVTLFDEDTPLELITALRPDLLFKGADYSIDQVVGGEFVQSYGGRVSLIDLEQGHSTTGIIKRMNTPAGA
jgi:D-beta-D-heptose 7-phosphate kinase/D-beta-D-heptose 1-phosphate adenosyltransferase